MQDGIAERLRLSIEARLRFRTFVRCPYVFLRQVFESAPEFAKLSSIAAPEYFPVHLEYSMRSFAYDFDRLERKLPGWDYLPPTRESRLSRRTTILAHQMSVGHIRDAGATGSLRPLEEAPQPKKHACASSDTSAANSSTAFTSGRGS
jgi:hypothetical protein